MLIKIVKGTYGHRPVLPNGQKSRYIVRVTPEDAPIDVDEAEGKRLIEEGTAEALATEKAEPKKKARKTEAEETKAPEAEDVNG